MYISTNCLQLKKIVVLGNLNLKRRPFFFICVLDNCFFTDFFFAFGKQKDFFFLLILTQSSNPMILNW